MEETKKDVAPVPAPTGIVRRAFTAVRSLVRIDGWENLLTGHGTTRDKRTGGSLTVAPSSSDHQKFEDLFHGDDIAATIAELPAKEMVREWFTLNLDDSSENDPNNPTGEEVEKVGQLRDVATPPPKLLPPGKEGKEPAEKTDALPRAKRTPEEEDADDEEERAREAELAEDETLLAEAEDEEGVEGEDPEFGRDPMEPEEKLGSEEESPEDENAETAKVTMQALDTLEAKTMFFHAKLWARVFGGSLLFIGADDGQDLSKPLNEENIRTIKFLAVFDRWDVTIQRYYTDIDGEKFGQPELYSINPTAHPNPEVRAGKAGALGIHESRFIRFDGVTNNRRRKLRNQGWGDSIYVRIEELIRDYAIAWGGAANLLADFAQAVFKIKGLAELMDSDESGIVKERMMLMDLCRSVMRAVPIDAESEEFSRQSTPMTGMADMFQEFEVRLAAAARMPATLLFGRAPAGLNATGASDIRFFYDQIAAEQDTDLTPKMQRLLKLLFLSAEGPTKGKEPENWSIEWNPLWQLDELQQATLRKTQAETDNTYISAGVVTADEVANSRFGGDKYSTDTVLDMEQRKADKEVEQKAIAEGLLDPNTRQLKNEDGEAVDPETGEPPEAAAPSLGGPPGFPPKAKADAYNPDQPRDEGGKWSETGAGGGGAKNKETKAPVRLTEKEGMSKKQKAAVRAVNKAADRVEKSQGKLAAAKAKMEATKARHEAEAKASEASRQAAKSGSADAHAEAQRLHEEAAKHGGPRAEKHAEKAKQHAQAAKVHKAMETGPIQPKEPGNPTDDEAKAEAERLSAVTGRQIDAGEVKERMKSHPTYNKGAAEARREFEQKHPPSKFAVKPADSPEGFREGEDANSLTGQANTPADLGTGGETADLHERAANAHEVAAASVGNYEGPGSSDPDTLNELAAHHRRASEEHRKSANRMRSEEIARKEYERASSMRDATRDQIQNSTPGLEIGRFEDDGPDNQLLDDTGRQIGSVGPNGDEPGFVAGLSDEVQKEWGTDEIFGEGATKHEATKNLRKKLEEKGVKVGTRAVWSDGRGGKVEVKKLPDGTWTTLGKEISIGKPGGLIETKVAPGVGRGGTPADAVRDLGEKTQNQLTQSGKEYNLKFDSVREDRFNPDQDRDPHGKWGSGSSGGAVDKGRRVHVRERAAEGSEEEEEPVGDLPLDEEDDVENVSKPKKPKFEPEIEK